MLIDCDIHQPNPSNEKMLEYLEEPYRSEFARFKYRKVGTGIRYEDGGNRWDVGGEDTTPEGMSKGLLDRYGHRFALLSGNNGPIAGIPDPDYAAAMCRAINRSHVDTWLPADPRYRLVIKLPIQDPQLAVEEVEHWAGHPGVVAAGFFATANRIAFGERFYYPIYEACQRHNLPIHIHPSTTATIANSSSTPAGMAITYLESHVCMPQFYMAQVASMVLNGVFEKFPDLRVVLVEGGVSWLPHLLWRMDAEYRALRQQAPMLKRFPSEYVKSNVRLTTQPVEEPGRKEHLLQIFDMIGGDEMLMYASDYPHWDFDEPTKLPKGLGDESLRRILHDNACEFFNLPQPEESEIPATAEATPA